MSKQKPPVAPPAPIRDLLIEPEVMELCRIKSRAQLWKLEQSGHFPRRKKYGLRRCAWPGSEIAEWIAIGAEAWARKHGGAAAA